MSQRLILSSHVLSNFIHPDFFFYFFILMTFNNINISMTPKCVALTLTLLSSSKLIHQTVAWYLHLAVWQASKQNSSFFSLQILFLSTSPAAQGCPRPTVMLDSYLWACTCVEFSPLDTLHSDFVYLLFSFNSDENRSLFCLCYYLQGQEWDLI